jgi:hypothetical protein
MSGTWLTSSVFWIISLPALALSGLLFQMILSLFSCCGTFKLRGRVVLLKWWMIPATSALCCLLWMIAVVYVVFEMN